MFTEEGNRSVSQRLNNSLKNLVLVANPKLRSLLIGRLVMTSNDYVVVNQLKQAYKDLI